MLFKIMNEFGSDKGNGWHNYIPVYEKIFQPKQSIALLEIQESNPQHIHASTTPLASVKAWRQFFHGSSYIYGCKQEEIHFNPDVELDVIIDDSGYSWKERIETMKNSWNFLKVKGHYIFEDILSTEMFQAHIDLFNLHATYKFLNCGIHELKNVNNSYDNNLIILQKSDASILNVSNTLNNFS